MPSIAERSWSLPAGWIVALRYLWVGRRDAGIRFLCTATAGGIALGVAALVLAVAALSGFQEELLRDVLQRSPVLQLRLPAGTEAIELRDRVAEIAGAPAQEVHYGRGWLSRDGDLRPVEIVGWESEVPAWFPGASARTAGGLLLPEGLARRWGVGDGDRLEVVSPRPQLSPIGPIPRNRFVAVVGTFDAGRSEEIEQRVALPLAVAERLLAGTDRHLDLSVEPARAARIAERLRSELPGIDVRTFRDIHRPLFFALRLEKSLMFVAVLLIVVVASQTLVASLALVITSKTREIGMLGAMGMTPRELRRIFLRLGVALAFVGVGVGGSLGSVLAWSLDHWHLLRLPSDVYVVDFVPFLIRPWIDLPLILGATLALTVLAVTSAARRATRLTPIEALGR